MTIQPTASDNYSRMLAVVILPDARVLNQELVRLGYSWWFRKYSKDESLGRLESEARADKRCLWADANPIPPWEWREKPRKTQLQPATVPVLSKGVAIAAMLPNPKGTDEGNEALVIANTREVTVDLTGWKLRDLAGNVFALLGTVPPKGRLTVTMTSPTMPLNNDGDEVLLIDGRGVVRSRVAYTGFQARAGAWVELSQ